MNINARILDGFTLVEMLITISVVLVLTGLGISGLQTVREQSRTSVCRSQMSQFGFAAGAYANEWNGAYPSGWHFRGTFQSSVNAWEGNDTRQILFDRYMGIDSKPYLDHKNPFFKCPALFKRLTDYQAQNPSTTLQPPRTYEPNSDLEVIPPTMSGHTITTSSPNMGVLFCQGARLAGGPGIYGTGGTLQGPQFVHGAKMDPTIVAANTPAYTDGKCNVLLMGGGVVTLKKGPSPSASATFDPTKEIMIINSSLSTGALVAKDHGNFNEFWNGRSN